MKISGGALQTQCLHDGFIACFQQCQPQRRTPSEARRWTKYKWQRKKIKQQKGKKIAISLHMYRVRPKINNIRQKAIEQGRDFTCAEQAGLFLLAWRVHHKHLVMSPQRSCAHSQCPSPSAAKAYLQEGRAQVFTAWVRRVRWHQLLTHSLRCLKQALKNALLSSKRPFWTPFIFFFFLLKCALQISSMYKCTISTKLGYKALVLCCCQCVCPQGLALRTQVGIIFLTDL